MSVRVIHVCAYFAPAFVYGGPPRSILGLCAAQRRAGIDARVITTTADGEGDFEASTTSYEGIPVHYCERAWPRSVFRAPRLRAVLREVLRSADVIHIHGLWNAVVWSAAAEARRAHRPYLLSPRGMLTPTAVAHERWKKRLSNALFDRKVIAGARMFHATSRLEAEQLSDRFGQDRVCYVPNGVDVPHIPTNNPGDIRRRLSLGSAPFVLFLGRIHPIKRLDLLAAAFARVRATHPTARLVITGPDEGGHRAQLAPLFDSLGDAVVWTGPVADSEKWDLLAAASLLVLCSDSESFGMSAGEAMAASRPVVVTRTCPWPDVEREQSGFWVEQSATAIGDAMNTLLADPADAARRGLRGRALIECHYTWSSAVEKLSSAYQRLESPRWR